MGGITKWIDDRIDAAVKSAVGEVSKDLTEYLDARFGKIEQAIDDTGVMVSDVSKDVGSVADSLTKLANSVLAIPQSIVTQVSAEIARINPFHLP